MTMREGERRKMNILEALIVASLLALGGMLVTMRDSIIEMRATQEGTNRALMGLQAQLANVPALSERVSRIEVRTENLQKQTDELQATRGLK